MNKKMHIAGYADTMDTQITLHILQIVQLQMFFFCLDFHTSQSTHVINTSEKSL